MSCQGIIIYKINILKKLFFLISGFLFTTTTVAQLYVKPDGTDASFVYVKDAVLYVENSIELYENEESATEKASIYFRDEGQLIQGSNVTNSGTGYISILQNNPDSDAWDYAYWSSPVGDQTITGTGNTNFGALRFFNPQGTKDTDCNCFLGTDSKVNQPTTNFNGEYNPDMRISSRWLYTYTNTTWTRIFDNSDVLPGRGFTMKGLGSVNHDQTYDFRGRPNNGNINTPILAGANSLSGNPYPSALDLNKVFYDNPEIESFRFWDEDHSVDSHYYIDNKGGYGIWLPMGEDPGGTNPGIYAVAPFLNYNNDGSTGTNTGVDGGNYARRFAPIGQGFMLFGASTGTVTYDNSQRFYVQEKSGMSDFRTNEVNQSVSSNLEAAIDVISTLPPDNRISHLRLNTYFNETHMRQLVLAFSNEATDGVDRGFDGISPMDSTSDVYFPIGDDQKTPYAIQTVPFDDYKRIPYTIDLEVPSSVVLTTAEEVKFKGSAFLYDAIEDSYQEITNNRTAQFYLPAGTYEDRFYITFINLNRIQQNTIENTKNNFIANIDFFQNNSIGQLEISNPQEYYIASARIFGMSGKLVFSASELGNDNRFSFPTANLSDGIYLVMLTTTDNVSINYKISVKNN